MWWGKQGTSVLGVVAFAAACGGVTRTERADQGSGGVAGTTTPAPTAGGSVIISAGGTPSSAPGHTTGSGGVTQVSGGGGVPSVFGSGGGGIPPGFGSGGTQTSGGRGGAVASGGTPGLRDAGVAPTDASSIPECKVVFRTTTVTANGSFAPRNVAAVWIADGAGDFVKTLAVWGLASLNALEAWRVASNGNRVDAVSGATRANHGPLQATWNCTGTNEQRVPYGRYQACIAFAEDRKSVTALYGDAAAPPIEECLFFDLNGAPFDHMASDDPHFPNADVSVSY